MNASRLDSIAKALAVESSRRSAVRMLVGAATLAALGRSATAAKTNADRVTICHLGDFGPETITVAEPAVAAHLAHGDTVGPCAPPPNFCTPEGLLGPEGTGRSCETFEDCPCGVCDNVGNCFCVNPGFPCVQGPPGTEERQCCSGRCGSDGICDCNPSGAVCLTNSDCCTGTCDLSNSLGGFAGVCS